MAYTDTDLANLQAAIAKGLTQARMGEEMVTYRSIDEMLRIERKIKRELGVVGASRGLIYPSTSVGFRD